MFELFVSLRYLLAKRREKFISVIAVLAVGGVTLSVATLIVVISVMTGFEEDLKDKILGTYAHLSVSTDTVLAHYPDVVRQVEKDPDVVASTPYIYGQVMLRLKGKVYGAVARGILPESEVKATNLGKYMVQGSLDFGEDSDGIVIGEEFAKNFGVKLGDNLSIISPASGLPSAGAAPSVLSFHVTGIFNSGMYEYDTHLVYVSLESAQILFGLGEDVHGINLKIKDPVHAYAVKERLEKSLAAPLKSETWMELNRNLFSALKTEKNVMFILLVMAIAVAAMNIASTLIMMVMEKTKDIGILKALGANNRIILRIFLAVGFLVGTVGTAFGLALGLLIIGNLQKIQAFVSRLTGFEVFPSDIYYLDQIPSVVEWQDVTSICLAAMIVSIVAAIYPAWRAAGLNAVEALRYE